MISQNTYFFITSRLKPGYYFKCNSLTQLNKNSREKQINKKNVFS